MREARRRCDASLRTAQRLPPAPPPTELAIEASHQRDGCLVVYLPEREHLRFAPREIKRASDPVDAIARRCLPYAALACAKRDKARTAEINLRQTDRGDEATGGTAVRASKRKAGPEHGGHLVGRWGELCAAERADNEATPVASGATRGLCRRPGCPQKEAMGRDMHDLWAADP